MTRLKAELSAPLKLYVRATAVAMGAYVPILFLAALWAFTTLPRLPWLLTAFTLICIVAIAVHVWALLNVVQQSDEFMRSLMAKRLLTAGLITIAAATAWGLLQNLGWAPAAPLMLIYIVFFVIHAALIPFINADRP